MDSELITILPQVGTGNTGNPTDGSDRVKAPVAVAGFKAFGGSQTHEEKKEENKHSGQQSDAGTALQLESSLWKRWNTVTALEDTEQQALNALVRRMESIETIVSKAKNIHKQVCEDHKAAMSHMRRLLRARQQKLEAKAAFQMGLEEMLEQAERGMRGNQKKRVASSPLLESRARKVSIAQDRSAISQTEEMRATPASLDQRMNNATRRMLQTNPEARTPSSRQGDDEWEIVRKKKRHAPKKAPPKRKFPRPRAEAVLIKTSGDNIKMSYSDILREVKQKASMEQVGSKVCKMRETKDGNLLLELVKGAKLEDVSDTLRTAVGDQLSVRPLVPTVTIELRDLEDVITKDEVKQALAAALEEAVPDQIEV